MSGWFLVHRKVFARPDWQRLVWLIGNANFEPGVVDGIQLQRGEFCWSLRFIARAWNCDTSAVSRYLQKLAAEGVVSGPKKCNTQRNTSRNLYRLENYDTYQRIETPSATPSATNQKKKYKRNYLQGELELPPSLDLPEVRTAIAQWLDYRKTIRRPYKTTRWLTRLAEMGADRAVAAIEYSLACEYLAIVEPKGRKPEKPEIDLPTI